ncbi:hypothetical protein PMIN01_10299 [Paraphaeosphaeria minitans]|uniref:Uncharacterized protein n=1 Tax=Paraphaeosphaeria minitans TaxID=565426 RepID=A0A9P6G8X7_9PLEO|nr:hypothetical protein PMIN01_10299 [Paraphaeosphaeria minitans]
MQFHSKDRRVLRSSGCFHWRLHKFLGKNSKVYTLPWIWCLSLERLESILQDAYACEERSLFAISQIGYIITFIGEGRLKGKALHEVYDKVILQDST